MLLKPSKFEIFGMLQNLCQIALNTGSIVTHVELQETDRITIILVLSSFHYGGVKTLTSLLCPIASSFIPGYLN